MSKRKYIAYGSNLNIQQMNWRCPDARLLGVGELKDWRLYFKGSKTGSYLTVEPCEGYSVPVAVWEVSDKDEVALDRYEGFPGFYYKKELDFKYTGIHTGKKHKTKAFLYIMHEDRPIGVPSRHYLDVCAVGYRFLRFNLNILNDAYLYSREVTKK